MVTLNKASEWRIDLARELSSTYSSNDDIPMICLGGSCARGIADEFSDLDIIVYWESVDESLIKDQPLTQAAGIPRTSLMSLSPGTFIESYHLDSLKIDFGHVGLKQWKEWIEPVHSEKSPDQELLNMVGGFLSSLVIKGDTVFRKMADELDVYPDSLSEDILKRNMGFYVKGYLEGQCFQRGDMLAYHDGVIHMLKKIINATAALNRYWFHAGEARWIDYHLSRMKIRPEKLTGENVNWILANPGCEAAVLISSIQSNLLDIASSEFPQLSEKISIRKNRIQSLAVKPCFSRPDKP